MIRGTDKNNPILIMVHGGTGKLYHFFEDYSNLSPELLTDDLIALTKYICERFGKDKVLLVGHSFGSYIAMQAAAKAAKNYFNSIIAPEKEVILYLESAHYPQLVTINCLNYSVFRKVKIYSCTIIM